MEHIRDTVKIVFRQIQRKYDVAGLSGPELLAKLKAEIKQRGIHRRVRYEKDRYN